MKTRAAAKLTAKCVLTTETAAVGVKVFQHDHPEYGIGRLEHDGHFWIVNMPRGRAVLSVGEFRFWSVLAS